MHLKSFAVRNFRRLKDITVDVSTDTTMFVGANNCGKTSATQVFRSFLRERHFSIHDFSVDCWSQFRKCTAESVDTEPLPKIQMDVWFEVDDSDLLRVIDLLPDLDWQGKPVGFRMSFEPKDTGLLLANYRQARDGLVTVSGIQDEGVAYHPWPADLYDYMSKRLNIEYDISYYKLDINHFDSHFRALSAEYDPPTLKKEIR